MWGGALPAEPEGAFQRRMDQAAEGRQEMVPGRFEDSHVEIHVSANQIAGAVLEPLHAAVGLGDAIDRLGRARRCGQRRRRRFHHLPQHKEVADEILGRRGLQVPRQHLGSSKFHSALWRTRVPILGRATMECRDRRIGILELNVHFPKLSPQRNVLRSTLDRLLKFFARFNILAGSNVLQDQTVIRIGRRQGLEERQD